METTYHKLMGNYIEINYAYSFSRVVEFLHYGIQWSSIRHTAANGMIVTLRKSAEKIVSIHVQTLDRPVAYKLFLPFSDVVTG